MAHAKKPVYTVGNERSYDTGIAIYSPFMKTGRRCDYPGGFAVRSIEDGVRLIEEFDKQGEWAIYQIDAKWLIDTEPSKNGWWHALLNDSQIIVKVEPQPPK